MREKWSFLIRIRKSSIDVGDILWKPSKGEYNYSNGFFFANCWCFDSFHSFSVLLPTNISFGSVHANSIQLVWTQICYFNYFKNFTEQGEKKNIEPKTSQFIRKNLNERTQNVFNRLNRIVFSFVLAQEHEIYICSTDFGKIRILY